MKGFAFVAKTRPNLSPTLVHMRISLRLVQCVRCWFSRHRAEKVTCPVQAPHRERIAGFDSQFHGHYLKGLFHSCSSTWNSLEHLIWKEIGCLKVNAKCFFLEIWPIRNQIWPETENLRMWNLLSEQIAKINLNYVPDLRKQINLDNVSNNESTTQILTSIWMKLNSKVSRKQ